MFTGMDLAATDDKKIVGRLVAAGILAHGHDGLSTTGRWHERMLGALLRNPTGGIKASLEAGLSDAFPDAETHELGLMAQVMLIVEAREAGWDGLMK